MLNLLKWNSLDVLKIFFISFLTEAWNIPDPHWDSAPDWNRKLPTTSISPAFPTTFRTLKPLYPRSNYLDVPRFSSIPAFSLLRNNQTFARILRRITIEFLFNSTLPASRNTRYITAVHILKHFRSVPIIFFSHVFTTPGNGNSLVGISPRIRIENYCTVLISTPAGYHILLNPCTEVEKPQNFQLDFPVAKTWEKSHFYGY